jgi:DUF1680 family protein
MSDPDIILVADTGTGYVLIPTLHFRWKKSTFTCCPPILQQLHVAVGKEHYRWKDVPTVPHDTPDEPTT